MYCSALGTGPGGLSRRARVWFVRLALTLVVGLAFALGSSEEAQAVSDTQRFRWSSSDLCISERSMIYEWSRNGVLYGQSVTKPFRFDCSTPLSKRAGDVAGRVHVYKWSDYYGYWYSCYDSDWFYNGSRTSRFVAYTGLGTVYRRWCGSGWYETWAQGSVWHNDAWRTTLPVRSGYAYFY